MTGLGDRCRCRHILLEHEHKDGKCLECKCVEYRHDAHQVAS